jgi:hypothetical protein
MLTQGLPYPTGTPAAYAVRCTGDDGRSVLLGSVVAFVRVGMGTVLLRSDALRTCRTLTVSPEQGDGYYSVAEIGFLQGN